MTTLCVCVSKVVSKYFFKKKKQNQCIADNQFGPFLKVTKAEAGDGPDCSGVPGTSSFMCHLLNILLSCFI